MPALNFNKCENIMDTFDKNINEINEMIQLVNFTLNGEEFGVDILQVEDIIRNLKITCIPDTPDYVKGIVNLRGYIIPVIDLRLKLGIAAAEYNLSTRIIVAEIEEKKVGFIVDSVNEVLRIDGKITEAPPHLIAGEKTKYIKAVAKYENRLITLIDIQKVLSNDEKYYAEIEGK